MTAHMLESAGVGGIKLDRTGARSAGERHERVRLGLEIQRGNHGHGNLDRG